ncbi:Coiled-coil domain-containing protein 18 Sarcoma antigen NY-SAR-24 [Channa argus]|uniref:Coiled-coil domain-containing protein 18 Sarcoma antigen NY-SAR-24 n=1 Tax=Channa argus TaxID=215402 RepID=A0A6G1QA53_CHAAH|nr:Coiled-coil domain-containing protein 18 Sarcoma antigen NY-SAR-24 [Channa argus]KAK2895487.1 hypothetical protein Q8A73_014975 [Channa argus]
MESVPFRRKAGCVRQENACLTMDDEQLINDLDVVRFELGTSKSQVYLRGPRVGVKNSVALMSDQIHQLEAELEAQAKALKAAELRAESSQESAAHSEIVVATLNEELNALREELDNKTATGKRAEQQRNQALQNAEKLKEAFKDYKATISIKLQRVMESESKLKLSLIECDREKEELEMKSNVLERERAEQSQTISQMKEELRQTKCLFAEHSDLKAQLEEAKQRESHLERQVLDREAESRELASLRKELKDLQTLTQNQEQRVAQSLREVQQNQVELASLESILALLHLREGAVLTLCARPCMLAPVDYSRTTHLQKLKPGEGYQQLLRVLQSMETEKTKHNSLIERLQERLSRAQEEIASLQSSMAQRATHYQSLHTELLDKVSQATDTEKELKRKCARVAALEKQLEEKTSAYGQVALKNTELENQLLERTTTFQRYQLQMTKKQRDYQQSLEKCQKTQSQQSMEQQHRIELMQRSVEEAQSRMLEMEQEWTLLQSERDKFQKTALLLQTSLDQLTQEKQAVVRHNEELLHSLQEQAAQSATKVCELQSCLSACREELGSYLQQMEVEKKKHESELQTNSDKVTSLQEKLHSTSLVCQNSSEQNLQLQLSLQQQQTMLTESTARISELEESQSQLHKQVSSLEQQLERARASLQEEVRNRRQDTQEKTKSLQEMNKKNTELSESVTRLTSEMIKCREELVSKESELQCLRRDVSVKTSQISCMEESLQHVKGQLNCKSNMVVDLEEKLHRCEADRLNCVQQIQVLEEQLQVVREDLSDTRKQLQEFRDILHRTQTIADERQASVDKLTLQLSETQRDLEERTHEVLDMDNALKERQGELQQRAQLLGQLDVAIKEHKQEMERKVDSLQQSLEASEKQLRDAKKELIDRNTKESQEVAQKLYLCQQKLQNVLKDFEQCQHHCEALTQELDATKQQLKDKTVQLCGIEEELALKEAHWLQLEANLQKMVSSLELELELEREQHSKELESLQQTRGQLLKVSEQMSSTMRFSQEQLTAKLQQCQNQLEQAKIQCDQSKAQLDQTKTELESTRNHANHLQSQLDESTSELLQCKTQLEQSRRLYEQTRLHNSHLHSQLEQLIIQLKQARVQAAQLQTQLNASEKSMETSTESLLIKESEVTRLQARISSLGRAVDRQNLYNHTLSLPAPDKFTHSPERSSSDHFTPSSPGKCKAPVCSNARTHSTWLHSPVDTQICLSPPTHTYLQPPSAPHLPESHQTNDCQQSSSFDSSLDLPLSLKATLREALSQQPWELSSPSISTFPDTVDNSWQGLSVVEPIAASDFSFNPLTYMVDQQEDGNLSSSMQEGEDECTSESRRASVSTLVGEEDDMDSKTLTGMLRFVNQTLAMQEDPSLWSSTGLSKT